MPKKIPLISVTVHRNGKAVEPTIGKPFDFTAEEIAEVLQAVPGSMRDPVNEEAAPAPAAVVAPAADTKAKGGKKATSDEDM